MVLSLERVEHPGAGLGERSSTISGGALPWRATLDLAQPVLPGHPDVRLLSDDRKTLILPHGGLVGADGREGELGGGDVDVKVDGVSRTVVSGAPDAGQVRVSAADGRLVFGEALPDTGTVAVAYHLGQWEQRVRRVAGVLRVDALAASGGDAASLSDAASDRLLATRTPSASLRLLRFEVEEMSSASAPEVTTQAHRRRVRFAFDLEHEINEPESSGGIIGVIPFTSRLDDGRGGFEGVEQELVEEKESSHG